MQDRRHERPRDDALQPAGPRPTPRRSRDAMVSGSSAAGSRAGERTTAPDARTPHTQSAQSAPSRPTSHDPDRPDARGSSRDHAHRDTCRRILDDLFGPPAGRSFAVRYWDGTVDGPPGARTPAFTLVLEWPGALRRLLVPPTERNAGAAYVEGHVDLEGDVEAAIRTLGPAVGGLPSPRRLARLGAELRSLPGRPAAPPTDAPARTRTRSRYRGRWRATPHSRRRDRDAVRYHYDVGNDFFALWLDRRMVYSCAYFETGDEDVHRAQEAKLDLICRKLRLREGERLLDIGCGWGGLAVYAAERYGVRATGITLSEPQAKLARERAARARVADRCSFEVRDYRDLPTDARFDKVASVGMVEHVGESRLPEYYAQVHRLLEPGGLFLNHGIVALDPPRTLAERVKARLERRWTSFIEHYVFPDARLLPPGTVLPPADTAGFELRDVENLREHYALTLRHWLRRLDARADEAVRIAGETTYRVWRLYMAGCAHVFASGRAGVLQTILARPDARGRVAIPRTRADLYTG